MHFNFPERKGGLHYRSARGQKERDKQTERKRVADREKETSRQRERETSRHREREARGQGGTNKQRSMITNRGKRDIIET